jgi:hypothetical protein
MQNRYVGDIGDYIKLSLLRSLSVGRALGVAWWLVPNEGHNSDGHHISYLSDEARWKSFDPFVFDKLREIMLRGDRSVTALQQSGVLPSEAIYFDIEVPCSARWQERADARKKWFAELGASLDSSRMVFLDPDNGIGPARFRVTGKNAVKSVSVDEILKLKRPGRVLVVYHHQTRMKGGHSNELHHFAKKLRQLDVTRVDALRAKAYSPRAFFIIDGDEMVRERAEAFAVRWRPHVSWHPNLQ